MSDRAISITPKRRRLRLIFAVLSWIIVVFGAVIILGEATIGPRAEGGISWLLLGRDAETP